MRFNVENPLKAVETKPRAPASKILHYIWGKVTSPHDGLQEVYIWWNPKRDDDPAQASRRRASASLRQKLAFIKRK